MKNLQTQYLNAVQCETLHSSQLNIVAVRVAKTPGALVEDPRNIVIRNVIKDEPVKINFK